MASAPTVFEEARSNLLALPVFACVLCVLVVASVLLHGIPPDTQTRVAVGVAAVGAVASVIWFLRWRVMRLATLSVGHDAIVMTPRGRRPQPRTIARRPDSRLELKISSDNTASPTSHSWWVLFDAAVGKPHIAIDIFGVDGVKKACISHGWEVTDPRHAHAAPASHRGKPGT